jgi:hypothetical protein
VINERNFRTLDLNLLRVFDEVMAERNLTRAAHNLAMTQPAVSNALKRLREPWATNWCAARATAWSPRRWRWRCGPPCATLCSSCATPSHPATLCPAARTTPLCWPWPTPPPPKSCRVWWTILENEAPGVNLRVLPLTTRDPRSLLESGSADLAIGHFPGVLAELSALHLQESSPRFLHQRLYDGEYVVVMRRGHPLAGPAADAGQLLRRPPPAGELFGAGLWLCGRGFGRSVAPAPRGADGEPVFHRRARGGHPPTC